MEAIATVKIEYDVLRGENLILKKQLNECDSQSACPDLHVGGNSFIVGAIGGLLIGFMLGKK